jgi:hypothetical protein
LVTGLLDGDQARDQVFGGMGAPLLEQFAQVFAQPQPGFQALLEALGLPGESDERIQSLGQQRRGPVELRLVFDRHPQQPADHRYRQWVGQIFDHIEFTLGRDLFEQTVDHGGDIGFQRLDDLGRERLADQPAQPSVVGRIEEQKAGGAERAHLLACGQGLLRHRGLGAITAGIRVAQDLVALGEGREDVEVVVGQLHRAAFADPGVHRVGVGPVGRVE